MLIQWSGKQASAAAAPTWPPLGQQDSAGQRARTGGADVWISGRQLLAAAAAAASLLAPPSCLRHFRPTEVSMGNGLAPLCWPAWFVWELNFALEGQATCYVASSLLLRQRVSLASKSGAVPPKSDRRNERCLCQPASQPASKHRACKRSIRCTIKRKFVIVLTELTY